MNADALEYWIVVASPLLHGAVGVWDELACLALPLFVAVTLWMLSRKPSDEASPDASEPDAPLAVDAEEKEQVAP